MAGLVFGDEGKGTTVDALVRKHKAKLVVRFGGGPQAAHHVVLPDGRWHCFAQFGSGTLIPGVRTLVAISHNEHRRSSRACASCRYRARCSFSHSTVSVS